MYHPCLLVFLCLFPFFLHAQTPPNDDLCQAELLLVDATCNGIPNGDNTAATTETGEPIPACFSGTVNSVWFKFVAPSTGFVNVSTDVGLVGSNDDTEIALYALPGANCSNPGDLVEVSCDQDVDLANQNYLSTISLAPVVATDTYYVQVSGWNGTVGTFCLEVMAASPPPPEAANDTLCNAVPLTIGASCNGQPNGNNGNATAEPGEPAASCFDGGLRSVWFSFVAPASGFVQISTDINVGGTLTDTEVGLFALPGGNCNQASDLVEIACDQDAGINIPDNGLIQVAPVTPGTTYYVQVSGFNGAQGSFCVEVEEVFPPANDGLCGAIPLTLGDPCNSPNGDNQFATLQSGEPIASCAPGNNSVWYQFVAPSSGYVKVSTDFAVGGTNASTYLGIFGLPGGTCSQPADLFEIACAQPGGTDGATLDSLAVNPGTTYYVQVIGPPGGSFCLSAASTTGPPLPVNDNLCQATPLTIDMPCTSANGDNTYATIQIGEPTPACFQGANRSIWYSFVAPPTGWVNLSTAIDSPGLSLMDTEMALYALPGGNCANFSDLVEIACNQDADLVGGVFSAEISPVFLNPGQTYYAQISGFGQAQGSFCIEVKEISGLPNDFVCDAIDLPVDGVVRGFTNAGATVQVGESALAPPQNSGTGFDGWEENGITRSAWFKFTAPTSGAVEVSLCHGDSLTQFDTQLAVYQADNCQDFSSFTLLGANDDRPGCNVASVLPVSCLSPDSTYYVLVDGWDSDTGKFAISIQDRSPAPLAGALEVRDPTCLGDSTGAVRLTPKGGEAPYTYSWNQGATTPDLQDLAAGTYVVTLTDKCGSAVSFAGILDPPAPLIADAGPDVPDACTNSPLLLGGVPSARGGLPFESGRIFALELAQDQLRRNRLREPGVSDLLGSGFDAFYAGADLDTAGSLFALQADDQSLIEVDTATGSITNLGQLSPLNATELWVGFAIHPIDGTAYALSKAADSLRLYQVDLSGLSALLLSSFSEAESLDPLWLALDDQGRFFTLDANTANLFRLNTALDTWIQVGPIGLPIEDQQDADFDPETGRLVLAIKTSGVGFATLYEINPVSGAAYPARGALQGLSLVGGLALADETRAPYEYQWTPATNLSDPTIAQPSYDPAIGLKRYSLTVVDACGGQASDTVDVTGMEGPSLTLTQLQGDDGSGNGVGLAQATGGTPPYQFNWDGGATADTVTGLSAGVHIVSVTDSAGCTTLDSLIIEGVVGIAEDLAGEVNAIRLFPNPSQGLLVLELDLKRAQTVTLSLYNPQGQGIWEQQAWAGPSLKYQLNLSHLPPGMYLYRIQTEKGQLYRRWLKQ